MPMLARLLLIIDAANAIVSNRKILLLHGMGSSAGAFMNRGSMGFQGAASASYHDGGRLAWQFGALDWNCFSLIVPLSSPSERTCKTRAR